MNQNDYVILFDENGQPYIAHAGWLDNAKNVVTNAAQQVANKAKGVGRGVRQNHKYILKVFENGRTRYFYKQEEVKAYYEAKKRGIKNAAEYAQNAVKDKASDVADAAKNVINKATGATANKTAETAKKNADDASRWAKMTERVHKENVANFKQNPTEANLARAKQSGQAVTRANQNEKNARKEADKAQVSADQHPVNKAKSAFDQAKKSADNAVANAKTNYDRMKSELRDRAEKAGNTAKSNAKKVVDKAKDIAGYDEKERLDKATSAHNRAVEDVDNASKYITDVMNDRNQDRFDAALRIRDERYDAANNANADYWRAKRAYDKTPLGMIEQARTAAKNKSKDISTSVKDIIDQAKSTTKEIKSNAQSVIDATKVAKQRETVQTATEEFNQAREKARVAKSKYDETHAPEDKQAYESADKQAKDASTKMTEAAQELTRLENSGSKGTLATYNAAKTERKRREVLGEFEQALDKENQLINKVKSFENGLKDKYGENWYNDATEAERNNLLSLRKQRIDAYQETQKDKYWEAYYDYYDSPLGRIERAKKNKNKNK